MSPFLFTMWTIVSHFCCLDNETLSQNKKKYKEIEHKFFFYYNQRSLFHTRDDTPIPPPQVVL